MILGFLIAGVALAEPIAEPLACGAERYSLDLLQFAEEGISITKELAVKNLPEFCRATTRNQAQRDMLQINVDATSDQEIKDTRSAESWRRAYHPEAAIRLDAFFKDQSLRRMGVNSFAKARQYLQGKLQPEHIPGSEISLDRPADPEQLARLSGFGARQAFALAACNELVLGLECPAALDKVIEMSMPTKENLTQVHLYREILQDKRYDEGLKLAALKILDRVEKKDIEGANLFDDVRESFAKAGATEEVADRMTWKTMGLLATGGANTGLRVFMVNGRESAIPKKAAIAILGDLAPVLDSLTIASGHLYSYPKGIHSTCDTGKPYHFWLTAYLGWELSRNGTGAKAAAAAAFLGQKGYQMMADTATRDPTKPLQEDFLGTYTNSIRMDLATASAGAIYGANAGRGVATTNLDIDEGVKRVVLESKPVDRRTEGEARALMASPIRYGLEWSKLMAPNAAFNHYKSELR